MKKDDDWIKIRVQAVEKNVPRELEEQVFASLSRTSQIPMAKSVPSPNRLARLLALTAAAASCVFLAVFLFTIKKQKTVDKTRQVLVQTARVEGVTAQTYIFSAKDPEMKIIWFEKIRQE